MIEQICLRHYLTPDKEEVKDFPKLLSATSFIRKRYYEIPLLRHGKRIYKNSIQIEL
jgi:hypothetical protein